MNGQASAVARHAEVAVRGGVEEVTFAPAVTRLGVFGRVEDQLIHGCIDRSSPGATTLDDWDTLGMRATPSRTTVLDGASAGSRSSICLVGEPKTLASDKPLISRILQPWVPVTVSD